MVYSNLIVNNVTHFVNILMHILKCLFVCLIDMVETKIQCQHRKVICDAMILYLYLLPEDHVRCALNPSLNAFDEFIFELVEHCWTNLCSTFSPKTFDLALHTSGTMDSNIKQILGQLLRRFENTTNVQIRGQP